MDRRSFLLGLAGGVVGGAGVSFLVNPFVFASPAAGDVPAPSDFQVEGVWTWFNDPRAIAVDDGIVVGGITTAGDLIAYELGDGTPVDLRGSTFQVDDHANPSFLKRSSDNRVMAFASAHNGTGLYTYLATSSNDAGAFGAETNIDASLGLTGYSYTNAYQLTDEANDPIYLFTRARDGSNVAQFYYSTSTDQGATWAAAIKLLSNNGSNTAHSPYVKIVQNGNARLDFFCTDGHPNTTATNSIYHFYYEGGSFRETDGTALTLPIAPASDLTPIYSGATNRAWIWDCAVDGSGNPVCVFAVFNSITDHRYRRCAFNGTTWDDTQICTAGRYLYSGESYYSGGVAIDPADIDTVFASRETDGVHSLYRYTFSGTWDAGTQITANEQAIRPYVVRGAAEPRLLYLSGDYSTYLDFETSIKLMDSTASAATPATDANIANVLLLARGKVMEDHSPVGRALTTGSGVTVTGAKTIMPGTSDGLGVGTGAITAPDAADLAFSGDFTIEIFGATFDATTVEYKLLTQWRAATGGRSWRATYLGNQSPDKLGIYLSTDGTASTLITGDWTPTGEHDLCFERSGTTVRVYVDGVMIGSGTFSGALRNSPSRMVIGSDEASDGMISSAAVWGGDWKEIRITKAARYASDGGYAVPSRPLPTT